jgi:formylglycine-generating enzyme required for sulfatase activity
MRQHDSGLVPISRRGGAPHASRLSGLGILSAALVSFLASQASSTEPAPPSARWTRIVHPDTRGPEPLRLGIRRMADGYRISISGPPSAARLSLVEADSLAELIGSPRPRVTQQASSGATEIHLPLDSLSSANTFFAARWEPAITNPHPDTMVWVSPGSFTLGSPDSEKQRDSDEGPTTLVHLPDGFFMDRYEVPAREYRELMLGIPNTGLSTRMPAVQVSWEEAVEFAAIKTRRELASGAIPEGYSYRLPTEAEWEFAARSGTTTRFNFGDAGPDRSPLDFVWHINNVQGQPRPSGQKPPNAWGIHDMHGNVAEWCLDFYAGYLGGQETNPRGPDAGDYRVIRGGSAADEIQHCRSAFRQYEWVDSRFPTVGFRLVLAPDRPTQAPLGIELVAIPRRHLRHGQPRVGVRDASSTNLPPRR